ncbi:uncharacterized protein [Salminus brasiliensis]|uniref:uncharacterized protein n=1 Tax=Salminus brasiliensis TaxID=930266 RepID=UPI003B82F35D
MSKLRRKRVTMVEESKTDRISDFSDQPDRLRNPGGTSSVRSCSTAESGPWWTAADLTAVEKVWVLTLQAICPSVFSSPASMSCVPELPQTPTRAEGERPSDWHWCRLDEDVTDLPALRDPPVCLPIHSVPPCAPNDGSLQLEPSPAEQLSETIHEQHTSTSQRHLEDDRKRCPAPQEWSEQQRDGSRLIKRPPKSGGGKSGRKIKLSQQGVQTPGYHSDGRDHRKGTYLQRKKLTGGEPEGISGAGLECEGKSKAEVSGVGSAGGDGAGTGARVSSLANDADCRPGTSRAEAAEAKLECCPMCLMPFPAGFSQMDCDGHLAQCLSEMNVDVVW